LLHSPAKKMLTLLQLNGNSRFLRLVRIFSTFQLVSFAWIFFRATNASSAFLIISKIFSSLLSALSYSGNVIAHYYFILKSQYILISAWGVALILFLFLFEKKIRVSELHISGVKNYFFFIVFLMLVILLGQSEQEKFIYFQF